MCCYTVSKAEGHEFLSSSATRLQLADLFFVVVALTEPLSVSCCVCAQHAGDAELAAFYAKQELVQDNPNPVKRFHANCHLAVINLTRAEEQEDELL